MITVSFQLSALIGKRVVLVAGFEDYPAGSVAVVEEFAITYEGPYFRVLFEGLPGSLEEIEPGLFSKIFYLVSADGLERRSLKSFFKMGLPPREVKFNLMAN